MATPRRLILLAYLAFISLGLPDTVLGVAWPSLRQSFGVPQSAMGLVLGAGMVGYFTSGLVAGALMRAFGVGGVLVASSALVALALAGYAAAPIWVAFFPVGFLMGLGSGAIDAGLNGYAARRLPARHLNWLHACWGVGASLGPVIMAQAIAGGLGHRGGYAALALLLAFMALAFVWTRRSWDSDSPAPDAAARGPEPLGAALGRGALWLHVAAFFLYTALEATAGQWCFTVLRERHGLGVERAGTWTAAYWGSLTLGRVVLGFWVDRVGADRLLRGASWVALLGSAIFVLGSGLVARAGLLLLGASLAPIFPTLMARTPARLGAAAAHAVGLQVSAATLGAALGPALAGVGVARLGTHAAPVSALALACGFFLVHEAVLAADRRAAVRLDSAPR